MQDTFDPLDFFDFFGRHVRFAGIAIGAAVILTASISLLVPPRYTATATLVIEPPVANDPRAATAVTPVYLESLRTYEQFAASDSLFAKACAEFHLEDAGETCTESFKKRVLRVIKLKDTKVLQISVTLEDPHVAQRVVAFLARETVVLNKNLAREGDRETLADAEAQLGSARQDLQKARTEFDEANASGNEGLLAEEIRSLGELQSRARLDLLRSRADIAELSERNAAEAALERMRAITIAAESEEISKRLVSKSSLLAAVAARRQGAEQRLKAAEARFDAWAKRVNDAAATSGLRREQLRIVDPGVVPQQPSFPNIPLFIGAAIVASALLSCAILAVLYGLDRQRRSSLRAEVAEISSNSRAARVAQR